MSRLARNTSRRQTGVSLPELLVVVAILALGVMVSLPMISQKIYAAQLRSSASQFAMSLRAARMVAVSKQLQVTVTVAPDGTYGYVDAGGKTQTVKPPAGVTVTSTPAAIIFQPDGSTQAASVATFEPKLPDSGAIRWRVDTPISGIPRLIKVPAP